MSEKIDFKTEIANLRCLNLIGTGNFGMVFISLVKMIDNQK